MIKPWNVNTERLISLLSKRMYTNVLYSGIKELIVNSLDAKREDKVNIQIYVDKNYLIYKDDGIGIDPNQFDELFGTIASSHERTKGARGFFGIGRLGLLSESKKGKISSFFDDKLSIWKFNIDGYEGPEIIEKNGNGILLEFRGLNNEFNLDNLILYLAIVLSIPLKNKECTILLNNVQLESLITPSMDYLEILTDYGKIDVWYCEDSEGRLYFSHKGIGVMDESFTGLTAFIDEDFLQIKTDREGFINDKVYQEFRRIVRSKLSDLRPQKAFKRMEVDFIKRLMKEFKRYWETKKQSKITIPGEPSEEPVPKLDLEFETPSEQIVEEVDEEKREIETGIEIPELDKEIEDEIIKNESLEKEQETDEEGRIPIMPSQDLIETEEKDFSQEPIKETIPPAFPFPGTMTQEGSRLHIEKTYDEDEEIKIVKIKGAKPMDLGPNQPMVYFETDPFIFIFNTGHPTFKKLVERGKLGSDKLAVIFERMFECAYEETFPSEDPDKIKKRWAEVDKQLQKVFK